MLGSHLVYELLTAGEEVTALKRHTSNLDALRRILANYSDGTDKLFNKISWIDGDILDYFLLDDIISNHKQVYHTAAFVSFHKNDHSKIMDINIHGTENIIAACIKHKSRLVYCSSIAALGRANNQKATTEEDYRDSNYESSIYSKSKFIAEQEVWRGIAEGLDAVMVNPSVILGPGDWAKSSAQLFPTIANGLKFYTNGSNGYVDVRDVAKVMHRLMDSDISAQRFILSSETVTYKQLFTDMAIALKVKPPSILANRTVSEISWRVLGLWTFITGRAPIITKETSQSANSYYDYSSQKIIDKLNYKFISVKQSIEHASTIYLQEKTK